MRIVTEHCVTFSTKERVPFKICFETISLEDAKNLQKGIKCFENQNVEQQSSKSLILPQSYFGSLWGK